jgi:hypothetical protein
MTSLSNESTNKTVDTALGATVGLLRYGEKAIGPYGRPDEGVQLDFFGVAFTRFGDFRYDVATDYRFGLPVTFAFGPWEGKVGYEHTSTHLGDDFIRQTVEAGVPQFKRPTLRDEIVLGLAYRLGDRWRFYGQFGYAYHIVTPPPPTAHDRYNFGVEWCRHGRTDSWGEPYAALDLDIRAEQNYTANWTAQFGWRWQGERLAPFRVYLEVYNGRSPYGQFLLQHERWIALGAAMDF